MELFNDFTTSVKKALTEIDPNWPIYNGLIVCGTHTPLDVPEVLESIKEARQDNIPFLGICMGMQLMAIEYARNVAGLKEANSTEIDKDTPTPLFTKMPKLRVGMKEAAWDSRLTKESFWHNYEFNTNYLRWFKRDWDIEQTEGIVTYMKLRKNFLGTQFHPEYQSTKDKPHLILKQFINECKMAM